MTTTLDPTVLQQAKGFLHDKGWGQGALVCDNGKVCALGALHLALGSTVRTYTEVDRGVEITHFDVLHPYEATAPKPPTYTGPKLYTEEGWTEAVHAYNVALSVYYNSAAYLEHRDRVEEYQETVAPYEEALNAVVNDMTNGESTWVADWNDLHAKDISDVERVFDLAIERINEKELVSV